MRLSRLSACIGLVAALGSFACSSDDSAGGGAAEPSSRVMVTPPQGWSIVSRAAFTPAARGDTTYFPTASLRGFARAGGTVRLALRATTTIGTTTTDDYYVAKGPDGASATLAKVATFPEGEVFFGAGDDVQTNPLASPDPAVGAPIVSWLSQDSFVAQARKLVDGALTHTCVAKGQPAPVQQACSGTQRITNLGAIAWGPNAFETWVRPNGELFFVTSREPGKGFALTRLVLDASGQWTGRVPELPLIDYPNAGLHSLTLGTVGDKAFLVASMGETGSYQLVAFELDPEAGTLTERARQSIDALAHSERGVVDPVSGQIAWLDRIAHGSAGEVALPLRDGMTSHTQLDVSRVILFDPRTATFRVLPDVPRERACFESCSPSYVAGASVEKGGAANPGSLVWNGGTLYYWTTESALTSDAKLVTREIVVLTPAAP